MNVEINREEAPLLALGLAILILSTSVAAVAGVVSPSAALQGMSLTYFALLFLFFAALILYLSRAQGVAKTEGRAEEES